MHTFPNLGDFRLQSRSRLELCFIDTSVRRGDCYKGQRFVHLFAHTKRCASYRVLIQYYISDVTAAWSVKFSNFNLT